MLRKFGFLLFFAITLAGSSGLRAEENIMWVKDIAYSCFAFHPNNQIIALADKWKVYLADVQSGVIFDTLYVSEGSGLIASLSFNSTGTNLAGTLNYGEGYSNHFGKIVVWNVTTKEEKTIDKVFGYYGRIAKVLFSPNDSLLIYDYYVDDFDKGVKIINTSDYSLKRKLDFFTGGSFSISHDSKYLALLDKYSNEYLIRIYDIVDNNFNNIISGYLTNPVFSPTKDELFALKWRKVIEPGETYWCHDSIIIFNYNNNFMESKSISLPSQYYNIDSYDVSHDGNFLAIGFSGVYITNINDNSIKYKYSKPNFTKDNPIAISNNMKYIAVCSVIMLKARFDSSSTVQDQTNQYFSFFIDDDGSTLEITRLNHDILINLIKVSDINGNIITNISDSSELNNESVSINTENFASGTYYLNIVTNSGTYSHSFIITR